MSNLRIALVIVAALCIVGCSKDNKDSYKGMSAAQIYAQAQKNMAEENYAKAAKDYEALESRFPYSEYSDKAQLDMIEAYQKHNDSALALTAADKFIRMNPRHINVAYAYYLKGMVAYDQYYGFAFRYLPLDRSARDPTYAQEAFDTFKELIERFPNSKYAPDARQRMIFLREAIASHEIQIVEYYLKRRAYLAAANRASYVVQHFRRTRVVPRALYIMVISYREMGMDSLADDAIQTLEANYPDCEELRMCRR